MHDAACSAAILRSRRVLSAVGVQTARETDVVELCILSALGAQYGEQRSSCETHVSASRGSVEESVDGSWSGRGRERRRKERTGIEYRIKEGNAI
jgi:hypothetical protein